MQEVITILWPNYALFCVFKFCEFISVRWMAHLTGRVVLTLLDYVSHVHICSKLQHILERQEEWPDICDILSKTPVSHSCHSKPVWDTTNHFFVYLVLGNPRSLKHQARLVIRRRMTLRRLNDPELMSTVPFPPALKNFLLYKEYDIYGRMDEL